jgi:hypothetical protein
MTWLWTILGGVVLGLLTNELFGWIGWLAERLLRRAARYLPSAFHQRYLDEWLGDLDTVPGKLAKLGWALKRLAEAPDLGQELGAPPRGRSLLAVRRAIDVLMATGGLVVFGPLLLAAALAIRLGGGPGRVLTRQLHVRPNGKEFLLLGFRAYTSEVPPRRTMVGRILEGLHLTKLPMMVNVLRGDLSVLGRKPEQPTPGPARAQPYDRLLRVLRSTPEPTHPTLQGSFAKAVSVARSQAAAQDFLVSGDYRERMIALIESTARVGAILEVMTAILESASLQLPPPEDSDD